MPGFLVPHCAFPQRTKLIPVLLAGLFLVAAAAHAQEQMPPPGTLKTEVTTPKLEAPPEPALEPTPVERPAEAIGNSRAAPVTNTIGSSPSASEGRFNQVDIANIPYLRPPDILELVPGLQVGNHAGTIKASEYMLRGFFLDNGTDISASIDDVPMNLPNNKHLHGYLDLNMLIPELVQYIEFQKGPYYAENGDFSLAAHLGITLVDSLPYGIFHTEFGKNDYYRELVANSGRLGQGTLLYAVEGRYYNGPWEFPNNARQVNGLLRYTVGDQYNGFRLTASTYSAVGRTEDAISDLAVAAGVLNRFGTFDPTLGLSYQRDQINGQWWHKDDAGDLTKANLYYAYSRFNIYANGDGDITDPVNGDTVQQFDHRSIFGGNLSQSFNSRVFGENVRNTFGLQSWNNNIPHSGVNHTVDRVPIAVLDDSSILEINLAAYWTNEIQWGPKVRTVLGLREDYFHWNVTDFALGPANSGSTHAEMLQPKGSLILGPWANTLFYLNGGWGFHSNDANGIFGHISSDFTLGPAAAVPNENGPATPLAHGRGAETGMKTQIIPGLTTTAALWYLRLQSELIFDPVGQTGEPRGASERYGVEISNTYHLHGWLFLDADWSASRAHFLTPDPDDGGTKVDQAIGILASIGPTLRSPAGYFLSMRYKYIGPRNLVPDGSISSTPVNVVDTSMGYENQRLGYGVELLNTFNSTAPDAMFAVDAAVNGIQFLGGTTSHPLEPFQARFYFTLKF